jgi:uncharacterized protein YndB with AHSA1/START domain
MTYDLKVDRLIDAPRELVFDTIVDPAYQDDLFEGQVEGWSVQRFEIDLRIGGTWTMEFGPRDGNGPNDVLTSVFTEIDRPRRLRYRTSMFINEWGRTVSFTEEMTFDDQDGKTLMTVVQADIELEADRDAFMGGTPGWVESLQRVVESRMVAARAGDG